MKEYIMAMETDMDGVDCYIRKGELIRCKDCIYYQENFMGRKVCFDSGMVRKSIDFCSQAKREEECG